MGSAPPKDIVPGQEAAEPAAEVCPPPFDHMALAANISQGRTDPTEAKGSGVAGTAAPSSPAADDPEEEGDGWGAEPAEVRSLQAFPL